MDAHWLELRHVEVILRAPEDVSTLSGFFRVENSVEAEHGSEYQIYGFYEAGLNILPFFADDLTLKVLLSHSSLREDLPHEVVEMLAARKPKGETDELICLDMAEDHLRSK